MQSPGDTHEGGECVCVCERERERERENKRNAGTDSVCVYDRALDKEIVP